MTNDVLPGTERAGGSAEAKYKSMAREWRRARLKPLRWVCLGGVVVIVVIKNLLPSNWAFPMGMTAGALLTLWMAFRDLGVPSYIEKWRVGAEGEKDTGRVLLRLGKEWTVRHDLQGRYGNVDHVVIGPAGVFLIDTKAWYLGVTTITSDGPEVTPDHDSEVVWKWHGIPGRMRGAAAGSSESIRALGGRRLYVMPVVAIWGRFPDRIQERGGVTYISADHLAEWLTQQPPRLSDQDRAVLARLY